MPRVNRAETEKNRKAIESAAARLVRERGLSVSVANLMAAAGLTHGGFYGHFRSKDELNSIACALTFSESQNHWKKFIAAEDGADAARMAIVEDYVSARSRAAASAKCPLAALAVDVSREGVNKPIREAFSSGLEDLVELFVSVLPPDDAPLARRAEALAQISTMVGTLVLARATKGKPISDELLEAARAQLLQR